MVRAQIIMNISTAAAFWFNLSAALYGIYYITADGSVLLPNLFGLILLAALILNIILVYINLRPTVNNKLQQWGTAYLIISILALPAMSLGGALASAVYDPATANLILFITVYPAYLLTLFAGMLHAFLTGKELKKNIATAAPDSAPVVVNKFSGWRKILLACLYLILIGGIISAVILLTAYPGLLQVPVSPNALFMAFFYPALAVLIIKIDRNQRHALKIATAIIGISLFVVFMLPLIMTPFAAARAEAEFSTAFGENWREQLSPALTDHFRSTYFSLPAYFLSFPPGDYRYQKDILFYRGTAGVDEGIELYYDLFLPPADQYDLPGSGSTIIRIHGGAWIVGDKGAGNMLQMNRYLAKQGYTVFDIQYGLTNRVNLPQFMMVYEFFTSIAQLVPQLSAISSFGAPQNVTGPFTLDDMMRHLAIFIDYLEDNAMKYNASTESLFISGGSAGGHLTTALALALSGEEHDYFKSSRINVRGYIPFYPANRATGILEIIGGAEEWIDVERLVREDSPPCLIFQGTNDGMVPADTARSFKNSYRDVGNDECLVIYLPLAAHAADYQFAGYYNQLFLYYMERFMALHR